MPGASAAQGSSGPDDEELESLDIIGLELEYLSRLLARAEERHREH